MKTMQLKTSISFSFFLLLCFSFSTGTQTPQTLCSKTKFPEFCESNLPKNQSATTLDFALDAIYSSLSTTNNLLSLVNVFLDLQFVLPIRTVAALLDCQSLATLNVDFLSEILQLISNATNLNSWQVSSVQTRLSAALNNHQTCLYGLQEVNSASNVLNVLLSPLTIGSQAYSLALFLFVQVWGDYQNSPMDSHTSPLNLTVSQNPCQANSKGVKVSQVVYVDPVPGQGNFTTISNAVAAAPTNTAAGDGYFLICIAAGVYQEYVSIASNQTYIMMMGSGINKTIITGKRSVVDGWTTYDCATFAVVGQGFVAKMITFQNTAGAIKQQAVAVRNGADLSAFYLCSFEGYQDTLYAFSMRQFYKNCDIYGTIDFIFGDAAVVFQSCNIYVRLPIPGQFDTITAQGRTDINENTGTSIQGCKILAAPDLASSNQTVRTYLGRPWKTYARVVVMKSYLGSLINPAGWSEWAGNQSLSTLYYAEYGNSGPGSNTTNRVNWPGYRVINATVAASFTVANFIKGTYWLNATGIPYYSGLH